MSVDTYLRGKDLTPYERIGIGDVEVLVSPGITRLAEQVHVGTRGAWFWRGIDVRVEHEHGPACRH